MTLFWFTLALSVSTITLLGFALRINSTENAKLIKKKERIPTLKRVK